MAKAGPTARVALFAIGLLLWSIYCISVLWHMWNHAAPYDSVVERWEFLTMFAFFLDESF